jgi:hypothetical protein
LKSIFHRCRHSFAGVLPRVCEGRKRRQSLFPGFGCRGQLRDFVPIGAPAFLRVTNRRRKS